MLAYRRAEQGNDQPSAFRCPCDDAHTPLLQNKWTPNPVARALARTSSAAVHAERMRMLLKQYRPWKSRKATAFACIWLSGLLLGLLVQPHNNESAERKAALEQIEQQIHNVRLRRQQLRNEETDEIEELALLKVTVWWLRPQQAALVQARQEVLNDLDRRIKQQEVELAELARQQRANIGLWSARALHHTRAHFWHCVDSGKLFARRQSVFDAMSRLWWLRHNGDDIGLLHILQLLTVSAINFTTGMCVALLLFAVRLPGFIASFEAGLVSSCLYYLLAMFCGACVIMAFLFLLYISGLLAILGGLYMTSRMAPGSPGWKGHKRANARR